MQRKIGFLPLDEYLGRYPQTNPLIFGPNAGRIAKTMAELWHSIDGSGEPGVVFVRHIGTGWDAEDVRDMLEKTLMKVPRGVEV